MLIMPCASYQFGSLPVAIPGIQSYTNAKSVQSHTDPNTKKFTMTLVPIERTENDTVVQRIHEVMKVVESSTSATNAVVLTAPPKNLTASTTAAAAAAAKLDTDKLRAAAGGGQYDEEEDPLNAPEILAAVAGFKKKLEDRDLELKTARQEAVDRRLEALILKTREDRLRPKVSADENNKTIEPVNTARETSKRGVSNLPAWMTAGANSTGHSTDENGNKNKRPNPGADLDPQTQRKQKIELADGSSMAVIRAANEAEDASQEEKESENKKNSDEIFAKPVNWKSVDSSDIISNIRPWVTEKIVEYLGEEEVTLIDFVIHQISKHCTPKDMLEELTMVLDEDAEVFVVSLWEKLLAIQ